MNFSSNQHLQFYLLITFIFLLFPGCNEEYSNLQDQNITLNLHNIEEFMEQDQVKIVVANSIENLFLTNKQLKLELLNNIIDPKTKKAKEYLYIQNKDIVMSNGYTLENNLLKQLKSDKYKNILKRVDEIIPNLVIKTPDWCNIIFKNKLIEKIDFSIVPGIQKSIANITSTHAQSISLNVQDVPLQVKESEKLVPVDKTTGETIWRDEISDNIFPVLSSCEVPLSNYQTFENKSYIFIDRFAINNDLRTGRLCSSRFRKSGTNEECEQVYYRDCVEEKNVIEGIKLANNTVFKGINNQPGGEDVISLHYTFVASQMCGDLSAPKDCPPTQWKFVFFGTVNDFFEIQYHSGYPTADEIKDVIFRSSDYYIKSFPVYYDIPVDLSFEQIYSQAPYLINSSNSTWDGNVYGSVVSFSIHEHDDVIVKETQKQTIKVSNTTKVSSKLTLGKVFEAGGDFSNSVTRTSEYTYEIEAGKDVELGQNASIYYDNNYQLDNFFGINKTTGSVNTHFAYYQY